MLLNLNNEETEMIIHYLSDNLSEETSKKLIQYLSDTIPEDTLKKVWDRIQTEGHMWLYFDSFGFGIYVRNTLRNGGFDLGVHRLDNEWASYIIKVVHIKFGSSENEFSFKEEFSAYLEKHKDDKYEHIELEDSDEVKWIRR